MVAGLFISANIFVKEYNIFTVNFSFRILEKFNKCARTACLIKLYKIKECDKFLLFTRNYVNTPLKAKKKLI